MPWSISISVPRKMSLHIYFKCGEDERNNLHTQKQTTVKHMHCFLCVQACPTAVQNLNQAIAYPILLPKI